MAQKIFKDWNEVNQLVDTTKEALQSEIYAISSTLGDEYIKSEDIEEIYATKEEVNGVEERLNTLLDSDEVNDVIDTFKEVEDFLKGVSNEETLTSIVKAAADVAEQNAKDYVDSLAVNYDAAGAADAAKEYADAKFQEKGDYLTEHQDLSDYATKEDIANDVKWDVRGDRKHIVLPNHMNIIANGVNGSEYNLAMVSKWDVADFGSASIHMNLNSLNGKVTINDNDTVATLKDMNDELAKYQPKGEYLTEHQSLEDYALKSDLPSVEGLASEAWVEEQGYLTEQYDDTEIKASLSNLSMIVKLLKDELKESMKSEVVMGESLGDGQFTYAPENGDLYIIDSEISGTKGASNGKVMFDAETVNISSIDVHDVQGTYNLFEQGQTAQDIKDITVSNITAKGSGMEHNVINAYNLSEGAVVTLKDSVFTEINPNKTNLIRISNYKNVENVTIVFDNVKLSYAENADLSDYGYFGFLLYQAVKDHDSSYSGVSCVNTWKVIFKNCELNGEPITSLNFGNVKQVAYAYNFNGGGSVTSIDDETKCGMSVEFIND